MADYTNKAQQRILRLVGAMCGHEQIGLSLAEVAESMSIAPPMALRDLQNLEAAGWGRRMKSGRWCLDAGAVRPLANIQAAVSRGRAEMDRIETEYLGGRNGQNQD